MSNDHQNNNQQDTRREARTWANGMFYGYGETQDVPGVEARIIHDRDEQNSTQATLRTFDYKELMTGFFDRPLTGQGHWLKAFFVGNAGLLAGWTFNTLWGIGTFANLVAAVSLGVFGIVLGLFAVRALARLSEGGADFNVTCSLTGAIALLIVFL